MGTLNGCGAGIASVLDANSGPGNSGQVRASRR